MKRLSMLTMSAVLICSCAHIKPQNPSSGTGDQALVILSSKISYSVELLAISDEELFVLWNQIVCVTALSDVQSISIQAYRRTTLSGFGKFLLGVPTVGLEFLVFMAGWDTGYPEWSIIAVAGMACTVYGLSGGMPRVNYQAPVSSDDRANIRLYCRYPQDLTAPQWQELLDQFSQEALIELKRVRPPYLDWQQSCSTRSGSSVPIAHLSPARSSVDSVRYARSPVREPRGSLRLNHRLPAVR